MHLQNFLLGGESLLDDFGAKVMQGFSRFERTSSRQGQIQSSAIGFGGTLCASGRFRVVRVNMSNRALTGGH